MHSKQHRLSQSRSVGEGRQYCVILVEDNPFEGEQIKADLEGGTPNYKVYRAADPQQVDLLLGNLKIDAVILDEGLIKGTKQWAALARRWRGQQNKLCLALLADSPDQLPRTLLTQLDCDLVIARENEPEELRLMLGEAIGDKEQSADAASALTINVPLVDGKPDYAIGRLEDLIFAAAIRAVLSARGPLSTRELAAALGLSKSQISRRMRELDIVLKHADS